MTIKELIEKLKKCPDDRAEVRYRNMEIDDTVTIGKVIIKYHQYHIKCKYEVILD